MARVTIEEISRRTGLSRGTVSRALNDRPDISEQTKQRVLAECQKLNYVPSRAARSLATGRAYTVAVVVDDLRLTLSSRFLQGAIHGAGDANYVVNVVELSRDPETRLRALANERIDGVLVCASLGSDSVAILRDAVNERNIVSSTPLPEAACDVLTTDDAESGRLVAVELLRFGAEGVLYVHAGGSPTRDRRLAGVTEVIRSQGLSVDSIVVSVPAEAAARRAMLAERVRGARRIGAVDDFLATEVMFLCAGQHREPGRDVAIIGQGNEPFSALISPTLTSVELNGEEIGRRAFEMLLQRVNLSRMDAAQRIEIAPRLIGRASSGGAA
ncbi:MAG: HTH-type transcriptional regulator DegA [Phycisphaerae bacterium]|nr:HTH-type transcriptional regulator DegA [Phycisphaerae bacterium]